MSERPLRIAQVSTGLLTGGAETVMESLIGRLDRDRFESVVVSLTTTGVLGPRIADAGIEVIALNTRPLPTPSCLARIRSTLRRLDADVVQTWAIYANVLGGIGAKLAGGPPVAWGVHHAGDSLATFGRKLLATQRLERRLSFHVPARIVACSEGSARMMGELRYPMDRVVTIPNGFDTDRFAPDSAARERVRTELGIGPSEVVIGHVARLHPVKGHPAMLAAAAEVAAGEPRARFVLCGTRVAPSEPSLAELARPLGERLIMLGERAEMAATYPAFDVCVSSSVTEALPLAVGEAMACGVPVVATDCGDSAAIVGDTGRIVPVDRPSALAAAIRELVAMPQADREELGLRARERILARYSLAAMAGGYGGLWTELAGGGGRRPARSSRRS